ncbi:MAG: hypothetical protein ACE5JU_24445 [Candidatus Binatia bacterium]
MGRKGETSIHVVVTYRADPRAARRLAALVARLLALPQEGGPEGTATDRSQEASHDIEAEEAVIGSLPLDGEALCSG